ncbi:hypothetical protein VTJ04DRAFT_2278 [Mycothermus thermophilus]|uniref:uncharacterized protein n=1 Tax=Humicola insolens TaxID=85995 RepID=UPI00374273F9
MSVPLRRLFHVSQLEPFIFTSPSPNTQGFSSFSAIPIRPLTQTLRWIKGNIKAGGIVKLEYSFVAVAGWPSHQPPSSQNGRFGHHRSLSSILRSASPKPPASHARSNSTTEQSLTPDVARFSRPSTPQSKRLFVPTPLDDDDLSTLPDPRSRGQTPSGRDATSSPCPPDPDDEVTALSTKLIRAINHQTALDDHLAEARLELEKAKERIRELEALVEEQRKTAEAEKAALEAKIAEEKKARLDTEVQKKKIEQELENLTAALFEEANKMVISAKEDARLEQEALQRKNDQLRAQLADTEGLLLSQQEQLVELKHVLEQLALEKTEPAPPTVPSSPGVESFDAREIQGSIAGGSASARQSLSVPMSPSYPTSFTHLIHPVLRTDVAAYEDFRELLRTSKRLSGQRLSTGSTFASFAIGLASAGAAMTEPTTTTPPSTSPQPSSSSSGTPSASSTSAPLPPLKETKFYKRVLIEDIEPTLRLDTAPGLSWLARRSVLAAMTDGSLVVEPTPSTATSRFGRVVRPELNPCALCGESRKEDEHLRTHRFRVSEADATQVGYPLCRYCLGRVRSTCEFLGFLRIVKDGHWRAEGEDAERAAWEESVRLREQMFWARIGGGVVPASQAQMLQQQPPYGRQRSVSSMAPSESGRGRERREKSPGPGSGQGLEGRGELKPLPELPVAVEGEKGTTEKVEKSERASPEERKMSGEISPTTVPAEPSHQVLPPTQTQENNTPSPAPNEAASSPEQGVSTATDKDETAPAATATATAPAS